MSGSGFSTAYGWPHEFYTVWKSFGGLTQNKGMPGGLLYIASNLFFYFSTIFFLSCLFFKKKV
jgi:hypothetical protein